MGVPGDLISYGIMEKVKKVAGNVLHKPTLNLLNPSFGFQSSRWMGKRKRKSSKIFPRPPSTYIQNDLTNIPHGFRRSAYKEGIPASCRFAQTIVTCWHVNESCREM